MLFTSFSETTGRLLLVLGICSIGNFGPEGLFERASSKRGAEVDDDMIETSVFSVLDFPSDFFI